MITRRRFLRIAATGAATAALSTYSGVDPVLSSARTKTWKGRALGADASITMANPHPERLIAVVRDELERLERIFSLYRSDSTLVTLNRHGRLSDPPPELLEALTLCGGIYDRTGGAFDPTVQSLWQLYGDWIKQGKVPRAAQISATMKRVGWQLVSTSPRSIRLRSGAQLTLNGIAQGYIADRVADLIRNEGLNNVLINTGEIVALGPRPDSRPWIVGLALPPANEIVHRKVELNDAALATSEPLGTTFDQMGAIGHIIDPRTGYPTSAWRQVSVSAKDAATADGLSTAFSVMDRGAINQAAQGAQVILM